MSRFSWVYTQHGAQHDDGKSGLRFVKDPTCIMYMEGGLDGPRCGRPATERVYRLPYWSFEWCPEHAAELHNFRNMRRRRR